MGSLLAIPLPTTASTDLTIYNAAVLAAIEQSRQRASWGLPQMFAGKLRIAAPQPANRLGIVANGSGGGSGAGTGTASAPGAGTSTTGL